MYLSGKATAVCQYIHFGTSCDVKYLELKIDVYSHPIFLTEPFEELLIAPRKTLWLLVCGCRSASVERFVVVRDGGAPEKAVMTGTHSERRRVHIVLQIYTVADG